MKLNTSNTTASKQYRDIIVTFSGIWCVQPHPGKEELERALDGMII